MKIPMSQNDAFALNSTVEKIIDSENKSYSVEDHIPADVLQELKNFAYEYLDIPAVLPETLFWYRKGSVHRQSIIQDFSKKYVEPFLNSSEILIGDTAFCINYPPHDVHIDNRDFRADKNKEGLVGTRSVVVPIEIDTTDYPKLYTANQYFYGPSTRMRNGCKDRDNLSEEVKRQKRCGVYFAYDYKTDGVKYLEKENTISYDWWKEHIDEPRFVPYSTFENLSIEKEHSWKPGNLIIFDSCRIHWAEKLTKKSATYKLGISLNYGIKSEKL